MSDELLIGLIVLLLLGKGNSSAQPAASRTPIAPGQPIGIPGGTFINPLTVPLTPDQINALNMQAQQIDAAGGNVVFQQQPANVVVDEGGELGTINSTGGFTVLPDPNGIGGGFAT